MSRVLLNYLLKKFLSYWHVISLLIMTLSWLLLLVSSYYFCTEMKWHKKKLDVIVYDEEDYLTKSCNMLQLVRRVHKSFNILTLCKDLFFYTWEERMRVRALSDSFLYYLQPILSIYKSMRRKQQKSPVKSA